MRSSCRARFPAVGRRPMSPCGRILFGIDSLSATSAPIRPASSADRKGTAMASGLESRRYDLRGDAVGRGLRQIVDDDTGQP